MAAFRRSVLGLVAAIACAEPGKTSGPPSILPAVPRSSGGGIGGTVEIAGNGPGACLAEDAVNAGQITESQSLNCRANDLSIAARPVEYSVNGGSFQRLDAGETIRCYDGDLLRVSLTAELVARTSGSRTDVGIWVSPYGDALNDTGGSCLQYTLSPAGNSSFDADGDQCGDLTTNGFAIVPLDTLFLVCEDDGSGAVHIGTCLSWSQPGADRVCPTPGAPGILRYRYGSLPGNVSKCNCNVIDIPVQFDPSPIIGTGAGLSATARKDASANNIR